MKRTLQTLMLASVLGLGSCVTIHGVTNNEVGTKKGTVTNGAFKQNVDIGYSSAAAAGKIDKIGTWEIKTGFMKISMTVTGEKAGGATSTEKEKQK